MNTRSAGSPVGRLAPSPTGAQHVGNARTYLIAWLSARAYAVVSTEPVWSAVRRLAMMLLLNGELDGKTSRTEWTVR